MCHSVSLRAGLGQIILAENFGPHVLKVPVQVLPVLWLCSTAVGSQSCPDCEG